jgi:Flp pilus assembly protein TadG
MKRLDEKGYVLVFTTLMFALLMFFVGFATDGGRAYLLRAELTRTVDGAAVAAASRINLGLPAAENAACESARMNGMTNCANLTVTQVTKKDAAGNDRVSVQVDGTATAPTVFVRAGKFFGCGTNCDALNVASTAVATAGGTIDLVATLDITSSMTGAKIVNARLGANALVDALLPSGGSSTALVSMVPFKGCYWSSNTGNNKCADKDDYPSAGWIVPLTSDANTLYAGINAIRDPDDLGGSGTNVCGGLKKAREKLFGPAARPNSTRYIIILTDSESYYWTDNSPPSGSVDPVCFPNPAAQNDNATHLAMGVQANNLATQIKNPTSASPEGQAPGQLVKIFVIMYGPNATGSVPADCDASALSTGTATSQSYTKNLSRCIASSAGDVYLAPNDSDISAAFQQIISRLPVLLIN